MRYLEFLLVLIIQIFHQLQVIKAQDGGSQSTNFCPDSAPNLANNFYIKTFRDAAIAVDNEYCSNVGKDIILKNGSAVDAAIAAGLCNGLMNAQSGGIGGGLFMVIYLKDRRVAYAINGREKAPLKSFETMFQNKSSIVGGLATAIPGEIAAYWQAYQLGGRLPWATLLQPAIDMCLNGYRITKTLANWMSQYESYLKNDSALNRIFINPITNTVYKFNDTITNPQLGATLQLIAKTNITEFYNGSLARIMVDEINENGGNVTLEDFNSYTADISDAVEMDIDDDNTIFTHPLPSSGILVPFIMRIMKGFNLDPSMLSKEYPASLFYHRLIESFKHAYAHRALFGDITSPQMSEILAKLKDENYISKIRNEINSYHTFPSLYYSNITFKEDHGTTHISIVANGDAVALTSTINTYFGAKYAGNCTGIIYNDQMDDFSTPGAVNYFGLQPTTANFIRPGKRPMSSMSPTIIIDRKTRKPKLVIGASGGSRIIAAVAQVAIKILWMGMDIKDAIDDRRVHHQLYPTAADFEEGFDSDIRNLLRLYGHDQTCYKYGGSVVQGIYSSRPNTLDAYSDPRKGGISAGI